MPTKPRKKAPGRTLSQEERRAVGAKIVKSFTLSVEAIEALDLLRGSESASAFLEELIHEALHG